MSHLHRLRTLVAVAVSGVLVASALTAPASAAPRAPGQLRGPTATAGQQPTTAQFASARQLIRAAPVPKPAAPAAPRAAKKGTTAVVTWKAPKDNGNPITGYVVTSYRDGRKATTASYDASTTSRRLKLASAKGTWTFTVAAKNAGGTGPASKRSGAPVILALPSAPTIIAVYANSTAATLSWTPGPDGGSPVTNWVITPYVGGVPQATQTIGPATTGEVTGLTAGVTYRFTVAARTAQGTGPASPLSPPVTTNVSPTLSFGTPGPAAVGVAYVANLSVVRGVPPFVWSVASGVLPPGLTLNANTGTLSGVPTTAGSYPFVVLVTDSAGNTGSRLVVLVVNQAPQLQNTPLPLGEVGAAYSFQLLVVGGTAPFSWSLASGSLPTGLTLDPATGLISGRPTASGAFPFSIRVTDAFGLSDTQSFRTLIQPKSVVTLSAEAAVTNFGTPVTFDVTIGPGVAEGTVTLIDVLPNGTDNPIGTFPVTLNAAQFQVQMPAFGLNNFRVEYSATNTNGVSESNTVTIDVRGVPGQLLIDQFALSGVGGLADQFVELRNTTGINLPIAGFTIQTAGGPTVTIPASARPLPPNRGYLVAATDYSLTNILPDLITPSLGTGGGLRLITPDVPHTVMDRAGSAPGYFDGSPLPAFSSPPFVYYGWVRLRVNGAPLDTNNNLNDFRLVATVLGPINGVPSALGSPSPQNSLGTYQQNAVMQTTRLDPGVASSAFPNREIVGNRLILRDTITNRSATPITQARLKITSLSQVNGAPKPGGPTPSPQGNLRLVNPTTPTSSITLSSGQTVTVNNLRMDAPATDPPGGGLNTTLNIPIDLGGLGPGKSVFIALTFVIDTPGPFWVGWNIDALGGPSTPTLAKASLSKVKGKKITLPKAGPGSAPSGKGYVVGGTLR
ncbi:putative Ig domain-containing protein [Micromonospora sp. NPDC000089]|uniref:putative Ig domain-containing protein n=1 Tax=unclassified Micromonospora TaxID=2617518 RepID=UPI003692A7DA